MLTESKARGFLDNDDRISIVNICVGPLISKFGHYPSSLVKECMAKAIIEAFPVLGSQEATSNCSNEIQ